ncbi:MAG TPA: hypothetical protein VIT41_15415 [Microlunatus sp.]
MTVWTSKQPASWSNVVLAGVGAAWSAFLLPPQLLTWSGSGAPDWADRLAGASPYRAIRRVAATQGVFDDYALFGSLVAPSFLVIGLALWRALGSTGRWTRIMAIVTMLGTPIVILSYTGHAATGLWRSFWGTEIFVLLAIGLCAIPASILAYQHGRLAGWRFGLLISTLLVLITSTVLLTYWPHGTLVGYGIEVALLAAPSMRPTPPG